MAFIFSDKYVHGFVSDEEIKALGVEWSIAQCKELIAHGVPSIHFYTMSAADSIARIARNIY